MFNRVEEPATDRKEPVPSSSAAMTAATSVTANTSNSTVDRKEETKKLLQQIPTEKAELFAWKLKWDIFDEV